MGLFSPSRDESKSSLGVVVPESPLAGEPRESGLPMGTFTKEMVKTIASMHRELAAVNKTVTVSTATMVRSIDSMTAAVVQSRRNGQATDLMVRAAPGRVSNAPTTISEIQSLSRPSITQTAPVAAEQSRNDVIADSINVNELVGIQEKQSDTLEQIQTGLYGISMGVDSMTDRLRGIEKKFETMNDVLASREAAREAERGEGANSTPKPVDAQAKDTGGGLLSSMLRGLGGVIAGLTPSLKTLQSMIGTLSGSVTSLLVPLGKAIGGFVTMGGLATAGTLAAIGAGLGVIAYEIYIAAKWIAETKKLNSDRTLETDRQEQQLSGAKDIFQTRIDTDRSNGLEPAPRDEQYVSQFDIMQEQNELEKIKERRNGLMEAATQSAGVGAGANLMLLENVRILDQKIKDLQKSLDEKKTRFQEKREQITTDQIEFVKPPEKQFSTREDAPYSGFDAQQRSEITNIGQALVPVKADRSMIEGSLTKNHQTKLARENKWPQPIVLPAQNTNVVDQSSTNYMLSTRYYRPFDMDVRP
jgi:hypothetical protein